MKLTVACVYKKGDGFTKEYVRRLRDGVAEHCHIDYNFIVVEPERELHCFAKGFWIKLELFKKGRFNGPVVYLDLDTIIIGDVTELFTYPHKFTMGTDWNKRLPNPNSTFMAWDGRQDLSHLDVSLDVPTLKIFQVGGHWGDQWFIYERLGQPITWIESIFPNTLISYKFTVLKNIVPASAKIVAFHGSPRPHEICWKM